ncbi:unnamed protein product [Cuscuta europaea]|uniref:Uncharacterized protein n=1 Tax=Cuscuta europaea TaxID=41803 RepID=A0A9P1EKR4_CUSEU|nr:unnamed protein product [Cuscuta europaea]
MPAHIKSSMFGCTLTIPITDGKLNMGTWQDLASGKMIGSAKEEDGLYIFDGETQSNKKGNMAL